MEAGRLRIFESIATRLKNDARVFEQRYEYPLDLGRLLADMGLHLRFVDEGPSVVGGAGCEGALVKEDGGGWVVLVAGRPNGEKEYKQARQRFTIAHEVGHYLIEGTFAYRPVQASDYWRLEDLCNGFAARLLAPDSIVVEATMLGHAEAASWRYALAYLETFGLSLRAAARRLVERVQDPISYVLLEPQRGGAIRWVERSPTWPRPGRGRSKQIFEGATPFSSLVPGESTSVAVKGCTSATLECLSRHRFLLTAVAGLGSPNTDQRDSAQSIPTAMGPRGPEPVSSNGAGQPGTGDFEELRMF